MIKKNKIGLMATWIYVFLVFVTSDSLMFFVASAILGIGFILCSRSHNSIIIKGNAYFYIQLFFIGYCLFQIIFRIAVVSDVSWSMSKRLIVNCIDELMLFNILIRQDDIEDIFKALIYPFTAGIILIIFLQIKAGMLFAYRLTTVLEEGKSYKFLGLTINAGVATMIGHCAVCIFAFSLIYFYANKKKKYLLFTIIGALGVLLSSSRKALAVVVVLMFVIPQFYKYNKKKIQRLIVTLAGVFICYILIMNVPLFYNIIGIRIERMFTVMSTGENVDYSINVRSNLKNMAWEAFLQRPIVGWGINSFKTVFNNGWIYSHCNYIELLVGTGLIGTVIFLSKYVYIFRRCFTLTKLKSSGKYYGKCLAVWFLMVWVMEYWQVAYFNERMIIHYIFGLAIIEWINRNHKKNISEKDGIL